MVGALLGADIISPLDRGRQHTPVSSVPVMGDVRRNAPAVVDAVHGDVESVERLEEVERVRVETEHVADERRPAALVGQDDERLRTGVVETQQLHNDDDSVRTTEERTGSGV